MYSLGLDGINLKATTIKSRSKFWGKNITLY
jgi:hypothetical protein